jgi:uncharacterized protein
LARVTDETTGSIVASRARIARSMWARFRGLMLSAPLEAGEGLVIEPCNSIHMMFMRFPIDAVFYDREGKVTRVAHGVPRWVGLALGGRGARGVVELPVGAADSVEPGHVLVIDQDATGEG